MDFDHVDNEFLNGCGFDSNAFFPTNEVRVQLNLNCPGVTLHSQKLQLKLSKLVKGPHQRRLECEAVGKHVLKVIT